MLQYPQVALLTNDIEQAIDIADLLCDDVGFWHAHTLGELENQVINQAVDVVLCSWRFEHGSWRTVLQTAHQYDPDLPVIVFSDSAREKDWIEVIEAGAFDLVCAPYIKQPLLGILEEALMFREMQEWKRPRQPPSSAMN